MKIRYSCGKSEVRTINIVNQLRFKETEIGKVPEEWETVSIKDIGKVFTGKTPSTFKSIYWNGDIPFITPEDMTGYKYISESRRCVTKEGANQVSKILPKNTLLIVCIGSTVGKVAITDRKSIVNQQINAVICSDNISCDYIYYAILFRSPILRNFSGVAAVPIIKKSLFETFKVPLPKNVEEQNKIAEILSTVDQVIEEVGESISKTERLKEELMRELLTKGIGHKEFKETEIGKVPEEWETVSIKDIGKVFTGKTPSTFKSIYWNGDIPFITPEDMTGYKYISESRRCVTKEGANQVSKILPKNTLLIVCIGSTVGKVAITDRKSIVNQQINAVICSDNISCDYIYYAILFRSPILRNFSGVAAVPIIKKSLFETFKVPLPKNVEEQNKIAEILSTVDERIQLLKEKKKKLERVKKGLMDDLLTGRRRVKI